MKNGYSKIPNWKTFEDALYADAKANVLFKVEDKTMICEVQFLFTKCQEAKKIGHKFYSLERQLGLFTEIKWKQAKRENPKSLPLYFTKLVEERNLKLLSLELSANPENVKYFQDIWLIEFDKRKNAPEDFAHRELQLMLHTIEIQSQKQTDPALYKDMFFNKVSALKTLCLAPNPKDSKLVCIHFVSHVFDCLLVSCLVCARFNYV